VRDLNLPYEIESVATVREPNGLALSSRNARLTTTHKHEAQQIYLLLKVIVETCRTQEMTTQSVQRHFTTEFQKTTSGTVEYVEVVNSETLAPVSIVAAGCTICVAVWFDNVRLIDNISQ
jgi:pantoate--beta-alanine ligase